MVKVWVHLMFTGWLVFCGTNGWASDWSVAFYYGAHAPVDELKAFDVVVVDPDQGLAPQEYQSEQSELFAYVSVGELEPYRLFAKSMPKEWLIGENKAWHSQVIDQSRPEWAEFMVSKIISPLWERGYRGFFLDTLDSYQLVADTPESRREQEEGLIRVIHAIKTAYPEAKLIVNRGFEIIPSVAEHLFAVAIESLYRGWDQAGKQYVEVSAEDREWILQQVNTLRESYGLPIIILDYLPPKARQEARSLARKIAKHGLIPWISNPELNQLGVGTVEIMPRKVFAIFDGGQDPDPAHSDLHRFLDMPLNYLGYVPEHWDAGESLPDFPLVGRYAGIVTWLPRNDAPWGREYHQWLMKQIDQGVRVAIFDHFGFPIRNSFLKPLSLQTSLASPPVSHVSFSVQDKQIGYEINPIPNRRTFVPLALVQGKPLLQLETTTGQQQDVVSITPWGGFAISPYALMQLPDMESYRWLVDPIWFLQKALHLPAMPVPDTTTENGHRLLLVHVDGDGFPSRAEVPGTPFAGQVFLNDILRRYRVPTTVSLIEGEVGPAGLYPEVAGYFEDISRSIFALPHVELASHSYSHPFYWRDFVAQGAKEPGRYHLAVPNYHYGADSLRREIQGSIEYINRRLAPPGKQVNVFLWTGDCDPSPEAVQETYAIQVGNMNGGDTVITKENNTLTAVAPLGINKGGFFQIYAPNQNENIYTNEWLGPFYGFERVIETFDLTNRPRRLKPINIYYHTYSASKKASLVALHKVYRWALQQPVNPIYVSEYIHKVQEFNRLVVARTRQVWHVRGANHLRELRVSQSMGYPDFTRSQGVVGFSDHGSERFLHLAPAPSFSYKVAFTPQRPRTPYLVKTNAQVRQWRLEADKLTLRLQGYRPLTLTLAHVKTCRAESPSETVVGNAIGDRLHIQMTRASRDPIHVSCG